MVQIKLSISGQFEKRVIDRKTTLHLGANLTLQDVLNRINNQFLINITPKCVEDNILMIVWNENSIHKEDLLKEVQDGDELVIFQPLAGG